ncbi:energy-coupling factor ABC transporter ATP-binding protein [bacterium]|nr:energy-coupling factor ABC transporter ATP-binding protein [bacterium]
MEKSENLYSINGLEFSYDNKSSKKILDIDFLEIEKGSIYAFLGANGCGKTTLLKLLNGLLLPTKGTIKFKGLSVVDNNPLLRMSTVYLHQNPYLFSQTVAENIAFGLKVRKYSKESIAKKIQEMLELVDLSGFENTPSNELSGGESQRVSIARAFAVEPEVLLMDEPTASVDKQNISNIERILLDLNSSKSTTVIISSHNESFSEKLADNIYHIEKSKLIHTPK